MSRRGCEDLALVKSISQLPYDFDRNTQRTPGLWMGAHSAFVLVRNGDRVADP